MTPKAGSKEVPAKFQPDASPTRYASYDLTAVLISDRWNEQKSKLVFTVAVDDGVPIFGEIDGVALPLNVTEHIFNAVGHMPDLEREWAREDREMVAKLKLGGLN